MSDSRKIITSEEAIKMLHETGILGPGIDIREPLHIDSEDFSSSLYIIDVELSYSLIIESTKINGDLSIYDLYVKGDASKFGNLSLELVELTGNFIYRSLKCELEEMHIEFSSEESGDENNFIDISGSKMKTLDVQSAGNKKIIMQRCQINYVGVSATEKGESLLADNSFIDSFVCSVSSGYLSVNSCHINDFIIRSSPDTIYANDCIFGDLKLEYSSSSIREMHMNNSTVKNSCLLNGAINKFNAVNLTVGRKIMLPRGEINILGIKCPLVYSRYYQEVSDCVITTDYTCSHKQIQRYKELVGRKVATWFKGTGITIYGTTGHMEGFLLSVKDDGTLVLGAERNPGNSSEGAAFFSIEDILSIVELSDSRNSRPHNWHKLRPDYEPDPKYNQDYSTGYEKYFE